MQSINTIMDITQTYRHAYTGCFGRRDTHEGKGSKGLDFFEFLSRCQSEMLAHRDVVLRNHLTELTDHELVATRKSKTGQHTLYYIPLAEEVIRGVILASEKGEDDAAGTP